MSARALAGLLAVLLAGEAAAQQSLGVQPSRRLPDAPAPQPLDEDVPVFPRPDADAAPLAPSGEATLASRSTWKLRSSMTEASSPARRSNTTDVVRGWN